MECIERTIFVWSFYDAPDKYKKLSDNGGDEDWLALVPKDYPHYIPWLERGTFGVCDISSYEVDEGIVYIGAHS